MELSGSAARSRSGAAGSDDAIEVGLDSVGFPSTGRLLSSRGSEGKRGEASS